MLVYHLNLNLKKTLYIYIVIWQNVEKFNGNEHFCKQP